MAASDPKDEVRRLVNDLDQAATVYADHSHDDARRRLRRAALRLASCLETPVESFDRTLFEVNADREESSSRYRARRRLTTSA